VPIGYCPIHATGDSNDEGGYDRAWFDEVLATVDLRPEDAVD
jgi:hypothetical protein